MVLLCPAAFTLVFRSLSEKSFAVSLEYEPEMDTPHSIWYGRASGTIL
jgi:hypothetical protein